VVVRTPRRACGLTWRRPACWHRARRPHRRRPCGRPASSAPAERGKGAVSSQSNAAIGGAPHEGLTRSSCAVVVWSSVAARPVCRGPPAAVAVAGGARPRPATASCAPHAPDSKPTTNHEHCSTLPASRGLTHPFSHLRRLCRPAPRPPPPPPAPIAQHHPHSRFSPYDRTAP
jgi:hypothetical protein